jgi:uncharacterized membrane protein YhhN
VTSARLLITLTAAGCAALVGLQLAGLDGASVFAKLVASTSFVALAIVSGARGSLYGRLIGAGLVLSWCGDMFLTSQAQSMFLAGLCAFLLAHVMYSTAFVAHGYRRAWLIIAAAPLTAIAIAVWTWLEPGTPADLSIPVRAYIAVITVMVIFAFGARGAGGSNYVIAGAVLFFLSDLSVAALRILETSYPTYVLGLPAYYAAQVCLALSISRKPA